MTAPADFRHDLVRGPVRMNADGDLVFFDNNEPVPASKERNGADADRGCRPRELRKRGERKNQ